MNNHQVTILESWKMSFRNEIFTLIQHTLNGLLPGTILRSKESGHSWEVVCRHVFTQASTLRRFEGEKETMIHFSFTPPFEENYDKFIDKTEKMESEGIYEYAIKPVGHKGIPRNGEVLDVINNNPGLQLQNQI